MPFVLQNPEQLLIDTVRITSFSVNVEPLFVQVNYERGTLATDGSFRLVDAGSVTFSADEVVAADPDGGVYGGMKTALYSLLKLRLGDGQIA